MAIPRPLIQLSVILAVAAIAYKGAHFILGDPEESMVQCNGNMQAFDLQGKQVFWRIHEARCMASDPNFEGLRVQTERLLRQIEDPEEWPEATCSYAQAGTSGYVWGYGTDYYEVEELDCLEPLRQLQEEKEQNVNIFEFFKGQFNNQPFQLADIAANFL